MITVSTIFFMAAAVVSFFGMIGEKEDEGIKAGCTFGLIISLAALALFNIIGR